MPADALGRAETDLHRLALPALRENGLVDNSEGAVVLLDDDPPIARLLDAAETVESA